jgi:hypothetical protein
MQLALVPTPRHGDRRDGPDRVPRPRPPVPWWKLVIGFAVALVTVAAVGSATGTAVIVILAVGFASLGVAGWLWGYDSRDGQDWRRSPPP